MSIRFLAVVASVGFVVSSCRMLPAPGEVRIYNLDQSEVITAAIADRRDTHSTGTGLSNHGEVFEGSYSTILDQSLAISMATSDPGYQWVDTRQSMSSSGNAAFGFATLSGDRGRVIHCFYSVDRRTGHGFGQGRDNKGGKYSVQF